jgi:hypothetical protein
MAAAASDSVCLKYKERLAIIENTMKKNWRVTTTASNSPYTVRHNLPRKKVQLWHALSAPYLPSTDGKLCPITATHIVHAYRNQNSNWSQPFSKPSSRCAPTLRAKCTAGGLTCFVDMTLAVPSLQLLAVILAVAVVLAVAVSVAAPTVVTMVVVIGGKGLREIVVVVVVNGADAAAAAGKVVL